MPASEAQLNILLMILNSRLRRGIDKQHGCHACNIVVECNRDGTFDRRTLHVNSSVLKHSISNPHLSNHSNGYWQRNVYYRQLSFAVNATCTVHMPTIFCIDLITPDTADTDSYKTRALKKNTKTLSWLTVQASIRDAGHVLQ